MSTYLDVIAGQIRAKMPAQVDVPADSDALFLIYALLASVKGTSTQARDVHDAWVLWMRLKGEDHAAMIPFDRLELQTQIEDEPFLTAIRAAVGELG